MGISTGILDKRWMARVGQRAYAEGLRLAALVETEIQAVSRSGTGPRGGQRQVMELASELAAPFMPWSTGP